MNKGTVFFHKSFKFSDGETGRKLLILLNQPEINKPYLVCKTTSKCKYGLSNEGCYNHKNIFVVNPTKAPKKGFHDKTWVQFDELFEFDYNKLLEARFKGALEIILELEAQTINAIVNCVKKSEDISKHHLTLLK